MNSQDPSRGREGSMGYGERRVVLDIDLNNPPPPEPVTESYPLAGQGNGFYQDQIGNGVELNEDDYVDEDYDNGDGDGDGDGDDDEDDDDADDDDDDDDDDDVVVISPTNFARATLARRSPGNKYRYIDDWLLLTDLGYATLDELRAFGASEGSSSARDLPVPNVPPVSSLTVSQQDAQAPTFTCGICMDQLVEETTTKCGHIFCRVCIDTAILNQRKCPTCRQKLNRRDTIRIYLPTSK